VSLSAIGPVMARIQSIESRFAVPSTARVAQSGTQTDFASTLSAAFDDSSASLMSGASSTTTGGATVASMPPTLQSYGSSFSGSYATPLPGSSGVAGGSSGVDPATPYASNFASAGTQHGVPPALLAAVGWVESRYRPDAVSSAGAIGVMQIMPFVADELRVDPTDPAQAIDGAARLLRSHYDRFGSWDLALAAYNAGAGAVSNAGNAIPSPGVAEYVRRVNERMMTS
jgi:soluble lytic murein transglycosylase-like protein